MQLALPQAVQPSALWPVHTEGILLLGCGTSCLAGIGGGIMSYTDLWIDLIWLLLYNKDANMGPGMAPAQSPAKQAAAWSQGRAGMQTPGVSSSHLPQVCLCQLCRWDIHCYHGDTGGGKSSRVPVAHIFI